MDRDTTIKTLYLEGFSGIEIADKVSLTPRQIQRIVKRLGVIRNASECFINAIKRGRMTYTRKPPEQKVQRKQINVKMRYYILDKYASRCCKCGNTAKDARIEIDHIDENACNNIEANLQVLCDVCNKGKYRHSIV